MSVVDTRLLNLEIDAIYILFCYLPCQHYHHNPGVYLNLVYIVTISGIKKETLLNNEHLVSSGWGHVYCSWCGLF